MSEIFFVLKGRSARDAPVIATCASESNARLIAERVSIPETYDRCYVYAGRRLIARYLHGSEVFGASEEPREPVA